MNVDDKKKLLLLVEQGRITDAINQLIRIKLPSELKHEAISLKSRYSRTQQQERMGVASTDELNRTYNQITSALVQLINMAYPDEISEEGGEHIQERPKSLIIMWVGIVGSIASIIGLLLYFFPSLEESPQLTIYVTDLDGNVALEHQGELNTSIGNRPMRATIGEHGRTNFGDILPQYLGDSITIGLKVDGWKLTSDNTFLFNGSPIYLRIQKDNSLGLIQGIIKTKDGQHFIEGAKILINTDTTIFTNIDGIFKTILPEKMRVQDKSGHYQLLISKAGFKTASHLFIPQTTPDIRLEKE